jgi:hypothetical protein
MKWWERRVTLAEARFQSSLACETAKVNLAAYRAKAEIEWDMKWANPLDKTYRDEIVTIAWSLPLLGMFIPGVRDFMLESFKILATFDPNAPALFLYGWAIIFATTFGIKGIKTLFMPGRLAGLVTALGKVSDTVPAKAVSAAQDAVSDQQPPKE